VKTRLRYWTGDWSHEAEMTFEARSEQDWFTRYEVRVKYREGKPVEVMCSCKDFYYRERACKHIRSVLAA
ncbi:SWIM zinc finger family protein, partial [Nitrolancea hollandica]